MAEYDLDHLTLNLQQLLKCEIDLVSDDRDKIGSLCEELGCLKLLLDNWEKKQYKNDNVRNLVTRIRYVASKIDDTIGLFLLRDVFEAIAKKESMTVKKNKKKKKKKKKRKKEKKKKNVKLVEKIDEFFNPSLNLQHVIEEIEAIKAEEMEINNQKSCEVGALLGGNLYRSNSLAVVEKELVVVGLDQEANMIKEQLLGGKQLETILIIGMPGVGKTTLARKVYNDPWTVYYFLIRAWIYVSQEYRVRDLLLGILSYVVPLTRKLHEMIDEELGEELYKCLKGKRYLIVIDDLWDNRAWDSLEVYFPKDKNGSRIVFTSRNENVALHTKPASHPVSLRILTETESWDLFQQKVFGRKTCPSELMEVGKQIAKKCQGLPLTIVVAAGILANEEKRQERWKQFGESLDSCILCDTQLCMRTISLSYNHLPYHLKPCFLYFGAFPKDFEIPVRKLVWLWIAEGFIPEVWGKSLEDVAEEYLRELIGRSLVLVSQRRSDGGIKSCVIHDLLHNFCLQKAEEGCFLQHIMGDHHFISSSSSEQFSRMRRICIPSTILQYTCLIPSALNTRTFLCIAPQCTRTRRPKFISRCFKLLRVLDIIYINIPSYPSEIEQLVLLRYLGLSYSVRYLPASVSNLFNLETFILHSSSSVTLPRSIWKMVKLRHLCLTGLGIHKIEGEYPDACCSTLMDNLQTLFFVDPWSFQEFLKRTPNLRKLAFLGDVVNGGRLRFPDLDFLHHLGKLKLCNAGVRILILPNDGRRIRFPPNLTKLTLVQTFLKWDDLSTLGKLLPNLEVLKILHDACKGWRWKTREDFPQLKLLKLYSVQMMEWQVCSNHFPRLERIVLVRCYGLKKIPSKIGDIATLRTIEVRSCNYSVANSALQIKEDQESIGNNYLQVIQSNNWLGPVQVESGDSMTYRGQSLSSKDAPNG